MKKTILITGSTDGIGLEAAKLLAAKGHRVLLHGRNPAKLDAVKRALGGDVESHAAELSDFQQVEALAESVIAKHDRLDVLINNAGVFAVADSVTEDGLDVRFVVNTIAPYLLTKRLLPLLDKSSRVLNLSSAAQARVDLNALTGNAGLSTGDAYAQSKLALTMWSHAMAKTVSPAVIAINPGSMLGTKMVADAYGVDGNDVAIGADILYRAATGDEFANASGKYFDNDSGRFAPPHRDALDLEKCEEVVRAIEAVLG